MQVISKKEVIERLPYKELIEALRHMFASGAVAPLRHHHTMTTESGPDSTLLLMPSWSSSSGFGGVKLVNVNPKNREIGLPSISASYLLFDQKTGQHLCLMDASEMTARRTAAASALAASYLARPDSTKLLVVGAGKVGAQIPHAFSEKFQFDEISIWNRNKKNQTELVDGLSANGINAIGVNSLEEAVKAADIISCATLTNEPIIKGEWLRPGQHIDLIGSFTPSMREVDDETLRRSKIFVDTQAALIESGELKIPLQSGVIKEDDICASLYDLCAAEKNWRTKSDITLFKSVGHAIEDLAAAMLIYQGA
ncbi:Ornithine cyclodeaminase [hydrothermal vent metagenome]|uniref:Ornithine cyclodeaminase n=1 Tax=hydrothermal vent metagenome TaxID=652676 RepID=A0A3B0TTH9_9ZZZZ